MEFNIGKCISYFRSAKGITVNKLANLSGVSQSYLRDLELGNNNNPTIKILDCICQTLGISLTTGITAGVILSLAPISSCICESVILKERCYTPCQCFSSQEPKEK